MFDECAATGVSRISHTRYPRDYQGVPVKPMRFLSVVLLLTLPLHGTVQAQSNTMTLEAKKAVQALLKQSTDHYLKLGYTPISDDMVDMNALDGEKSDAELVYALAGGHEYLIHGVCDGDCDDLDINVYDDKGKLLASDTDDDDSPAVILKVGEAADFTVEVVMAACNNGPCYYAVDALQKK